MPTSSAKDSVNITSVIMFLHLHASSHECCKLTSSVMASGCLFEARITRSTISCSLSMAPRTLSQGQQRRMRHVTCTGQGRWSWARRAGHHG